MLMNRGLDKQDVVHIFNGVPLTLKREGDWVIRRDVEGPKDWHTA